MIRVENFLRLGKVALNAFLFAPRHREHPINVIARDIGLGAHWRHFLQARNFFIDFFARLFRQLRLFDLLADFVHFVRAVIAQLGLDRLHLFIKVIFALRLFHLALHAAADFLLDLEDRGFPVEQL